MSKTACWATNRLDVDIAEISFGYGSRYDMTTQRHCYHVSLEGAKCLARFDYPYADDILDNMCHEGRLHFSLSHDVREKAKEILINFWANKSPEFRKYGNDFIQEHLTLEQQAIASPVYIRFPYLSKEESDKKAGEWFKEIFAANGKYGCPDFHVTYRHKDGNCFDGGELPLKYVFLEARESQYPEDAAMYNRIRYMFDLVNGYEGAWDSKSTEMYMCSDFSEQFKMEARQWWWTHDFSELNYPGPITIGSDEEIVKMVELAANYARNNFYSWKLDRHCEDVHWQSVEERWSFEKIKAWFDEHSDYGNSNMHVVDVYKRDSDQELEIHIDNHDSGRHNMGIKVIFDKRKTYTTWTGANWWDWHKEQHQKFLDSGTDPNPLPF